MNDELKKIYVAANKLQYCFDDKTPRDLFRGQSSSEAKRGMPV